VVGSLFASLAIEMLESVIAVTEPLICCCEAGFSFIFLAIISPLLPIVPFTVTVMPSIRVAGSMPLPDFN